MENKTPRQIAHDPFGRFATMREAIPWRDLDTHQRRHGCVWCGGLNGYGGLFRYWTWNDDKPRDPGPSGDHFCSVSCVRTYYGSTA